MWGVWFANGVAALSFLLGGYGLFHTVKISSENDHIRLQERQAADVAEAKREVREECMRQIEELREDIRNLRRDRDYQRERADDLQSQINSMLRRGDGGFA